MEICKIMIVDNEVKYINSVLSLISSMGEVRVGEHPCRTPRLSTNNVINFKYKGFKILHVLW